MKFVIVSPRQTGGGAIVLHLLCKLLKNKGYDAKIFYIGPSSMKEITLIGYYWRYFIYLIVHDLKKIFLSRLLKNTKFIQNDRFSGYNYEAVRGCKRKWLPLVDEDTIVVYPDIVYGNPLKAKKVIRWLCYYYPYDVNDKNAYDNTDLFIAFREIFNNNILNPKGITVTLYNFDFELYKNTNDKKRIGCCYIIRKGIHRNDLPDFFDGPIIDNMTEKEIVKVFNQCQYCISYDTQTFYSTIAAICGCISIVIPEKGKNRADYLKKDDEVYGVAYGKTEKELKYAEETKDKMRRKIDSYSRDNEDNMNIFIQSCKQKFFK